MTVLPLPPPEIRRARTGVYIWRASGTPGLKQSTSEFHSWLQARIDALHKALDSDARVVKTTKASQYSELFSGGARFYPDTPRGADFDASALISGRDHFTGLRFSGPIYFELKVPIKNQPSHHGVTDAPTENYYCVWDGTLLTVMWDQEDERNYSTAGRIAIDVLNSALRAIGDDSHNQACNPGCTNGFIHTDLLLRCDEDEPVTGQPAARFSKLESYKAEAVVRKSDWGSSEDIVRAVGAALRVKAYSFAHSKNLVRRLFNIETYLQQEVSHLLDHFYEAARLRSTPIHRSLRRRLAGRGWKRHSNALLAEIWLGLASAESLSATWRERSASFEEQDRADAKMIFDADHSQDSSHAKKLDFTRIEAMTSKVADRLDNRSMLTVTAVSAIAGAIAGGGLSLIPNLFP